MSWPSNWRGLGPAISRAEADRLRAEAAANGHEIWIEARVGPEPEAEAGL
jgi:hypothetical protein